ncbi:hypothetical protein Patl1_06455 [Pistacia atlantica]|uniref:Uncharacterized protein n=1 Tax=Pistacia atlantica TaxID=434234 RepID=A0ACC1BR68_9ROSI|nr:hypothetical protein Patl1_06455 [Pistacia atlantica]
MSFPTKLLLFTAALLSSAATSFSATRCPNCGTTPVPYPLSTGPACGDQSYKVRCDSNNTLQFDTLNNSYPITSISPSIQRLVIKPASLLPNTCLATDLPHQGIQLNASLPFNITSSNTIMYLNCSNTLLGSPLNCSSASLCHVYVNATRDASACDEASAFAVLSNGFRRESLCVGPKLTVMGTPPVGMIHVSMGSGDASVRQGLRGIQFKAFVLKLLRVKILKVVEGTNRTALIAVYVQRMLEEEKLMETIDPVLREKASNIELETMKALAFLAVGCLEERRQNRPSMKEVAEEIEYIINIATAETTQK